MPCCDACSLPRSTCRGSRPSLACSRTTACVTWPVSRGFPRWAATRRRSFLRPGRPTPRRTQGGRLCPRFGAEAGKAGITPAGQDVARLVEEHLQAENLEPNVLGGLDPDDVHLAKTASRSILGVMNDAALHARYGIEDLRCIDQTEVVFLNRSLRRTLHNRAGEYVTPLDLVARRLGGLDGTRLE